MPTQSYIVEGKFLGEVFVPMAHTNAELHRPYSTAYFCPHCAEIWARCPVQEHPEFHALTVPCRKHPSRAYKIAGSMLIENQACLFPLHLPDELVRWEFDRHMAYWEQYND